jgi:hypothetical protein
MTNAAGTNEAVINVVEGTAGSADLGLNSGSFSASSFDWRWRHFFGNDFAVMERIRTASPSTNVGGRVALAATAATIGFNDSTDATADNNLTFVSGTAQLNGGRLEILPAASANSALYMNGASGHTGNLFRLLLNAVDKFRVDKDGNVIAAGSLTAGNVTSGRVTITPSAANTPTSLAVTGLSLTGTNIRVVACPGTSVPGTQVTGVGVTNVTSTGFTVWLSTPTTSPRRASLRSIRRPPPTSRIPARKHRRPRLPLRRRLTGPSPWTPRPGTRWSRRASPSPART